jgi:hypothetical protein
MEKTFFEPTVQLRCSKCNIKMPHVLVDFSEESKGEKEAIALNYECQECSERKKIFVFVTHKIS